MFNIFKKLISSGKEPSDTPLRPQIGSLSDNEIDYQVFLSLVDLVFKDENKSFADSLKTPGQIAFYFTHTAEDEICNGGFNQLYFNHGEKFVNGAIEGYKFYGVNEFAEFLTKVNLVYQQNKGTIEQYNDGTIESFSKSYENNPLEEYDEKFYKLLGNTKMDEVRARYVRNHIEEFSYFN